MSPTPSHPRPGRRRRAPMAFTGTPKPDTPEPSTPELSTPELSTQKPDGLQDLRELMEICELSCPPESLPPINRYLARMLEENEKINLSGIRDVHEALALHVVDSLFVWQAVAKAPRIILDIGSGNGFPGVAAACLWPKARVVLVERRQKKAKAIARCAKEVGIHNVEAMAVDAGQLPGLHPELRRACDLVLSRATAELAEIAKLAAPLLRNEGLLVQWKALQFPEEERRTYERQQKRLRLQSREDLLYVIHASEPRARRLVSALKL